MLRAAVPFTLLKGIDQRFSLTGLFAITALPIIFLLQIMGIIMIFKDNSDTIIVIISIIKYITKEKLKDLVKCKECEGLSLGALSLVMTAAILHAIWNFLAKKSLGGTSFVWLYTFTSVVIYSPLAFCVILWTDINIGWMEIGLIAASAVLHLLYAVTLQKGYRIGDFSLIYPIARGVGPMLIALAAFFLLKEELNILGKWGIVLIVCSIFIFTGGLRILKERTMLPSVLYGLLIGCMIASYSLLDKYAVSFSAIHPILLNYGGNLGVAISLFPYAKKHWREVRFNWNGNKLETIGIGLFNPLAYILVLMAMVHTPASYVAPVRELSILIGAILGVAFFKESFGRQRIIAAAIMVIGVGMVAVS